MHAPTFESASPVLKMKERTITPVKDINPMVDNMTLKGSYWNNCVDVIGTIVAIGNIVPVNGYGCSKIRRTVLIEDAQ
ncbi:hypothetical protein Tco_0134336 [Tanacetum coccineum]